MNNRTAYETPRLEVQPLRTLPSALASSGCHCTPSKGQVHCSEGSNHNHITHRR